MKPDNRFSVMGRAFAASILLLTLQAAHANGIYAPYVDVSLYPTPQIDRIGMTQGIQQFTLAFVVSNGRCTPSWGGVQPIGNGATSDLLTILTQSIANYRAHGGEIAISFGGAGGVSLMQTCTTVSALKAAYQTVIDTYHLTHLDFDIEGPALTDAPALERNFQATAQLEADYAARGEWLHVSITLPAMPTGLTPAGLKALNMAIANHTTLDTINAMAMDHVWPHLDMGTATISAAQALYAELYTAYRSAGQAKTDPELWQLVGVTPMIGRNDAVAEFFTIDNAQHLQKVAMDNHYGFASSWSVSRDRSCPDHATYTSPTCSGIVQEPYAFASIFTAINGHWGNGVVRDPGYRGSAPTDTSTRGLSIGAIPQSP
ncbi:MULTISPECIES: chitinase [unclassified Burkholderia]|uniref:chitinase n=1 Tax=unclassified Burkholderia TaxID=2613784 RepID=UPI00075AF4CC|nr:MULTISPECIES: chitinase [unclassified Burkholderia]KUY50827.1 hypothetical protein WS45_28225 [Burkholderia sp. RF2-non_BP3]KUY82007.1 hypothetical protein WS46_15810 [Burkholderia sp. RF4-BP95]KUY95619.1 hypothetical protein WS48_17475 [Burkholderia sp. RF7-non_BP1]